MKKAEFEQKQIFGLILGVGAVVVIFLLLTKLIGGFNPEEATGKSYFETFMSEIEKANDGKIGEFIMWQDSKDVGKQDVFLIYFDDKFKAEVADMNFVTFGNKNIICVCTWDGETGDCAQKNCENLDFPIENDWTDDSTGQWFIGNKDGITIERDGEKYLVKKIQEETAH